MEMTGAEAILASLKEEQVPVVFGYPGGAVLGLYDAIYRTGFPHILTGHEQGAVHAADGYARATGKVGVCIATSGPGVCNMVTGIATANMDSIPLVIISGQVATSLIGQDAFQEADTAGITTSITKYNYLVRKVENLPQVLKEAFYIARTGRPGPVLIDIVTDVFDARLDFHYPKEVHLLGYQGSQHPHRADVQRAAEALRRARRPVIMAGGGVVLSDTGGELTRLAEKTGIPVVTTLMGKGAVPDTLPQHLGMLGMHGSYAANMAVSGCDLLLAFGVRFDERSTAKASLFAPAARIVHFNVEPGEINKIIPVQVAVPGDLRESLPLFAQLAEPLAAACKEQTAPWREQGEAMKEEVPCTAHACRGGISPETALKKAAAQAPQDTIVVTDVGQHQMWAAQFFPTREARHFITSGGLGTMGFGLPAALGAKVGEPDKTVLLITGDGSVLMNCQEFTTLPTYGIHVKTIVLKNGQLGLVRQLQGLFRGGRYSQTELIRKPSMAKIAEAMGIPSRSISRPEELEAGLEFLFGGDDSALLEITIPEDERVYPVVPGSKGLDQMILGREG
ncbi:biosynthetic-type acetolactate synthase large subunit [Acidaminococcus sp. DS4831]|uniref:biosynthetic-type acetolactate synthase large subunit n=1 Tax=Acidaminococcus sp. DS4831 TaxID=3141399 RepID=UPI0032E47F75